MKTGTVTLKELLGRKRWDPRAHLRVTAQELRSAGASGVPIGALARERREQSKPPTDPKEKFVYIGLENVESGTGDIVGDVWRRGGEVLSVSKHFRRGDVLLSRLRPNLNKVCCPPFSEGYCSGEFIVLAPIPERVAPRVLRELLAAPQVARRFSDLVAGATLPRVAAADVLQQEVPSIEPGQQEKLKRMLEAEDEKRREWKRQLDEQPNRLSQLIAEYAG